MCFRLQDKSTIYLRYNEISDSIFCRITPIFYSGVLLFRIFSAIAPPSAHSFPDFCFLRVVGRRPKAVALERVGHVLLAGKMFGIVVRIDVSIVVAQLRHEICRRVAQMQRNSGVSGGAYQLYGGVDGFVGRVALGARGQINGGFSQGDAPFRPSDFLDGIEGGIGQ